MKQKEIYLANMGPVKGCEQDGVRPVVVVSGDTMNDNLPLLIVCPMTSSIKGYPATVFLKKNKANGLKENSEVLSFQVRSISPTKLIKKLGKVTDKQLDQIVRGIFDVIDY